MNQSPLQATELHSQIISLLDDLVKNEDSQGKLSQIYKILTNQDKIPSSFNETSTEIKDKFAYFCLKAEPLLATLYPSPDKEKLLTQIYSLLQDSFAESVAEDFHKWNQSNVQLITYGDSIIDNDNDEEKPLVTLSRFLEKYWQNTITGVHILPFNPYSSDDGFAVKDYLEVNIIYLNLQDHVPVAERNNRTIKSTFFV